MASNTQGSFNVGRDLSFMFVVNGQVFNIAGQLVTDVNRKVNATLHEVVPITNDGKPVFRTTYAGYEIDVHFSRQNGGFEQLVVALTQNYYTGAVPPIVTALETVRNPDQSVDQTQYIGGAIAPESLGSFKGSDPVNDVTMKIRFAEGNSVGGGLSGAANALVNTAASIQ